MDKNVSRRNEALKTVEDQMKAAMQRREELAKELNDLDQHRNDLRATMDILEHQFQGLQQVLERANAPQVEAAFDYDTNARTGVMNTAVRVGKW
jgi:chromosome segregation ATPase